MLQSSGSSSGDKKKAFSENKSKTQTVKHTKSGSEKPSKSSDSKATRSTADAWIDELEQKWSDRFNRLEALTLARRLDKRDLDPTFHPVKVTPTHIPPVGSMKATKPFMKPTDRPHLATDLLTQICFVPTTLLHRDSLPANQARTDHRKLTDLQICMALTPLLQSNRLLTNCLLHRPSRRASPVWTLTLKVISPTDQQLISLWNKVNCPTKILMSLLQTLTRPSLSNRITETMRGIWLYVG